MTPTRLPVAMTCLAILLAGLAVSGCGRRGAPEPPPSTAVLSTDEDGNVVETEEPADKPFILDGLLK